MFKKIPILSKYLTFLSPLAFESFDLSEFDIIISDSSSYAKGVLTKPDQLHVSYIHTPPRFLYGYSVENTKRNAWYYRWVVVFVDHFLRIWDYNAAQRPNYLVANSKEIQGRIKKFYDRESTVIYPPVELGGAQTDSNGNNKNGGDFYLIAGRLVPYKNFDVVISAFRELPKLKLKVIGAGPEEKRLRELAGSNVEFMGRVSDKEKHELMSKCLGLINSVEDEDFGIVPIEVLSHGKPVLAHKSAGHLETVRDGETGMYFDDVGVDCLTEALKKFDAKIKSGAFDPKTIRDSTVRFSKDNFKKNFSEFVEKKWENHNF
jgi:glycosyltransferase involved in cell wall biosynthesis